MKHNTDKLQKFLADNRKALNINGINKELELPTNCLSKFVLGSETLAEHHHKKVFDYFANLGYKEGIQVPNLELEELKNSLFDLTTKAKEKIKTIENEINKL